MKTRRYGNFAEKKLYANTRGSEEYIFIQLRLFAIDVKVEIQGEVQTRKDSQKEFPIN